MKNQMEFTMLCKEKLNYLKKDKNNKSLNNLYLSTKQSQLQDYGIEPIYIPSIIGYTSTEHRQSNLREYGITQ